MSILIRKINQIINAMFGQSARVLLYHSISDTPADPLSVHPGNFREQLALLQNNGFQVISVGELIQALRKGNDLRKKVIITFDDAFTDFYDCALPILSEFHYPATIFVPTAMIGKKSTWGKTSPNRPVMSLTQLEKALERGVEIGSHSVNHFPLPDVCHSIMEQELVESYDFIHNITGQNRISLAYPFGMAGDREQAAAEQVGYTSAFLANGLWGCSKGTDLFGIPREMLTRDISRADFIRIIFSRSDTFNLFSNLSSSMVSFGLRSQMQSSVYRSERGQK